jgi:hypothetical protein
LLCRLTRRADFDALTAHEEADATSVARGVIVQLALIPRLQHPFALFIKLEQPVVQCAPGDQRQMAELEQHAG